MILPAVLLLQGALGFGILRRLGEMRPAQRASLAFLLGLPASSILLVIADLVGIRLTARHMLLLFGGAAVLANIGALERTRAAFASWPPRLPPMRLHAAIIPLVIACLAAISVWQCIHLPVVPRDATTGMDLVAKYAVLEGRINSSVFTGPELRGQLSNQPYYAPFTMLMQIVFRLAGMPFGQIWLSVLFISFLIYICSRLGERLHPILSGFLVLSLVTIPLMYSYTYLIATDLANALFFGLGAMFLHDSIRSRRSPMLVLSGLFMGFSCWSRSETILFVLPGALLLPLAGGRGGGRSYLMRLAMLLVPSIVLFLVWHLVYFQWVFADAPRLGPLTSAAGGKQIVDTVRGILGLVGAHELYGTIFYLFGGVLLANVALFRDRSGLDLLAWIALLLIGFVVVVQLFPAAFVESTAKRGFFKLFPIMIAYMGESRLLAFLSERLRDFGQGPPRGEPVPANPD